MNVKEGYNKLKSILGLSLSLAKANFKTRNEGSYLGIFWYLLNPLAMFFIILMIGNFFSGKNVENYPVYLLLGLIIFNFLRQSTINSTGIIARNSGFIKSMKISSESFVISGVLQSVFSHFFEIILITGFLLYFKINLTGIVFYPLIFFFLFLFTLGTCFILSTAGAYINDLSNVWNVLINLLWFASPIFYVLENGIPLINKINPMFYFISVSRDIIIYNRMPALSYILIIILLSFFSLLAGLFIFEKFKNRFAELI